MYIKKRKIKTLAKLYEVKVFEIIGVMYKGGSLNKKRIIKKGKKKTRLLILALFINEINRIRLI